MVFQKKEGINIFYETYGEQGKTPIILIHGLGADHNMYKPQIKKYSQEGYYLVVPDMRGHGKTSKVKSIKLTDWIEDIIDLMDHLKLEEAILLGVSMGGVIVQKFITEFPERVKKFILSDTFGEIKSFLEKYVAFSTVVGFKLFKFFSNKFRTNLIASAYKNYSNNAYNYFKEVTSKADFNQLFLARKAINKIDILDKLNFINIPGLVLAGDNAKIIIKSSKKIVDNLNNVEFKTVNGGFDPSNLTRPDIFDEYVLEFIS